MTRSKPPESKTKKDSNAPDELVCVVLTATIETLTSEARRAFGLVKPKKNSSNGRFILRKDLPLDYSTVDSTLARMKKQDGMCRDHIKTLKKEAPLPGFARSYGVKQFVWIGTKEEYTPDVEFCPIYALKKGVGGKLFKDGGVTAEVLLKEIARHDTVEGRPHKIGRESTTLQRDIKPMGKLKIKKPAPAK